MDLGLGGTSGESRGVAPDQVGEMVLAGVKAPAQPPRRQSHDWIALSKPSCAFDAMCGLRRQSIKLVIA